MDADHADRLVTSHLPTRQAWGRTPILMADSVALCEAAVAPRDRHAALRFQPPFSRGQQPLEAADRASVQGLARWAQRGVLGGAPERLAVRPLLLPDTASLRPAR
jgi:hypothetical protein